MIKFENTEVIGWESAIRGMRNPLESWSKSDSYIPSCESNCDECQDIDCKNTPNTNGKFVLGYNDYFLMRKLINAGSDHRKFLRMINVYVDITAPLYWWKEFDTYKVGTVANSCSTMHKIHSTPITEKSFSLEHCILCDVGKAYIEELEKLRLKYNKTKDKKYWYALIQLLPSSYNQKRTVMLNYEVIYNIYNSRKNHKLDEWSIGFINWIKELPYADILINQYDDTDNFKKIKEKCDEIKNTLKNISIDISSYLDSCSEEEINNYAEIGKNMYDDFWRGADSKNHK